MFQNPKLVVEDICWWLVKQFRDAHARTAVVGLSGGADSALVAILCQRTFGPNVVCVKMPCHSSPDSLARANELIEKFKLRWFEVDLGTAFDSIQKQVAYEGTEEAKSALRSCLRAPTLDYVAKLTNGLIVGTGNRDEDEMTRYFQKRGDGAVDLNPIAQLHKSEVYQLLKFLDCPQSIIDAKPSADLLGPNSGQEDEKALGMTYDEIEWGIRTLIDFGLRATYQKLKKVWTKRQYEVLSKLDEMEIASRHKANMPPVCPISDFYRNT